MTEFIISGNGVSQGIRIGKAFKIAAVEATLAFKDIEEGQVSAEVNRLSLAKEKCLSDMDVLIAKVKEELGEEKSVILKGQKSFLSDPSFCPAMEKLIRKKLYSPEKAADEVIRNTAAIFEKMAAEYMRERAADIRDIGKRLMLALTGGHGSGISSIREEVILIAEDLAPSDTILLNKQYILALATKKGGKTSHTSIFANSMGIPAIVGAGDALDNIETGDNLIFDGTSGIIVINPEASTLSEYKKKMSAEDQAAEALKIYGVKEAFTKDGFKVEIAANIGTAADATFALEQGADGVGLLRTELIYMASQSLPDEESQFNSYREIITAMKNKPITIRTLDIGGDKELPYLKMPKELNPFLGYRAIRMCLDQKHLLVTQLRAILRASVYGNVKIMFPMISSLDEWRAAKKICDEVKEQLSSEGIPFSDNVELGIMVEIPSAAILAAQFAKEVDFFSIGTNDLVQYTLAVDRMNEHVAALYDHFHPAVMSLLQHIVEAAHAHGKKVGMCGGMAGDPLALPFLLAIGLDEFSMSANSIQKIKYSVNQVSREECRSLLSTIADASTAKEIREILSKFSETI